MPATFNWNQTIGHPSNPTTQNLGSTGNLFNFKNRDTIGISDYSDYPIPAGSNSYEVWLRGFFDGVYSAIYDFRFWMSTDFSPNTGLTVKAKTNGQETYAQPTNSTSIIAVNNISTSDPGTANVSYRGSLTSSIESIGEYTDYLVLQLQTLSNANAGDTSTAVFSLSYIEQ